MSKPLQQPSVKRDICVDSEDYNGNVICESVKKQQANISRRLDSGPDSQRVGYRNPEEFTIF